MLVSPSFQSVCKNNSVKERIYFSRAMWLTEYLKGAARFFTSKIVLRSVYRNTDA